MMPPGVPPIALFRTFVRNQPMTAAMQPWGRHQLGRSLAVGLREREIVIDRTCARCGCEYEWGVHVAFFAERAGLDAAQVRSLTHGGPSDPCWVEEHERLLIRLVDELHDRSDVGEALWQELPVTTTMRSCSTCSCSAAGTTPSASPPERPACRSRMAHQRSPRCAELRPPLGARRLSPR